MSSELNGLLERVALEAFETLGFLLPDLEAPEAPTGRMRGVEVAYTGPATGAVMVHGDEQVLSALALNMLGFDVEPDPALELDALGEIANVICGNVVPEVEDPSSVFRLSPPREVAGQSGGEGGPALRAAVRLGLEDGLVWVALLGDPS